MTLIKYLDKNILFFLCLACSTFVTAEESIANALTLTPDQLKHYEQNNFKILGVLQLESNLNPEQRLIEFSGIAWDQDQNDLILLSDRGFIIHSKPVFNKEELVDLEMLSYYPLMTAKGKKVKYKASDSEGIALINSNNNQDNDTELLICFERIPRVIRYNSDGRFISEETINNDLNNIKNYQSENKSLEAITLHNKFNIITGPERPLDNNNNLLSLHNLQDKQWLFNAENENYGSLVGLTTLPNNQIIALERSYPGVFAGMSITIHLLTLDNDKIKQKTLVRMKPEDGYFNDNFEGISWHKENRFFMVSDNNDNFFQKTLLIYFEIPSLKIN